MKCPVCCNKHIPHEVSIADKNANSKFYYCSNGHVIEKTEGETLVFTIPPDKDLSTIISEVMNKHACAINRLKDR